MRLVITAAGMNAAIVEGIEPGQTIPLTLRLEDEANPQRPWPVPERTCPCDAGRPFAECHGKVPPADAPRNDPL